MRVKANDVLDPNAAITRAFTGKIVGHFRRVGPNRWDDYELVRDEAGTLDVLPGVRVQLSRQGPQFRIRAMGKVLLVRWAPDAAASEEIRALSGRALREHFLANFCETFSHAAGIGAGAMIARKLSD